MNLRLSQAQVAVLYPPEVFGLQEVRKGLYHIVDRWKFEETREAFARFYDKGNVTHRALQKHLRAVR